MVRYYFTCMVYIAFQSCNSHISSPDQLRINEEFLIKNSAKLQVQYLSNKNTITYYPIDSVKKVEEILLKNFLFIPKDSLSKVIAIITKSWDRKEFLIEDKSYINSSFLLHQDSLALKAIERSSWKTSIDFNDFCEYVLPYKLDYEIVDGWRDSLYLHHENLLRDYPNLQNLDNLYNYHYRNTFEKLSSKIRLKEFSPHKVIIPGLKLVKKESAVLA